MLNRLLREKNMTKYRLSKESGVPYTTIQDICTGKTQIEKCAADTVFKIAKALGMTMDELIAPRMADRPAFDAFKSTMCQRLKEDGDTEFMREVQETGIIWEYYHRRWYPESFYMLAMLDYLSRENDVPCSEEFDELRELRLPKKIYPQSVLAMARVLDDESIKTEAEEKAIPEFLRFNIVEGEIRNVV